jgi:PAS domain-containing protein
LFVGTYTVQFADRPQPTTRYDYNQILYRLDLDDAPAKMAMDLLPLRHGAYNDGKLPGDSTRDPDKRITPNRRFPIVFHSHFTTRPRMRQRLISAVSADLVALGAMAVALLIRWPLYPLLENRRPYLTLFAAVAFAVWFARWRPATVAAIVGFLAANYFLAEPQAGMVFDTFFLMELAGYGLSAGFIIFFGEALHRARDRVQHETAKRKHAEESERHQEELLRATFASIGDAVITTDAKGRITFLNAVGESLTGWTNCEAAGQPLEAVFRIVNEQVHRHRRHQTRRGRVERGRPPQE